MYVWIQFEIVSYVTRKLYLKKMRECERELYKTYWTLLKNKIKEKRALKMFDYEFKLQREMPPPPIVH